MSTSLDPTQRVRRWIRLVGLAAGIVAAGLSVVAGDRLSRPLFDAWQRFSPRDLSATNVRVVLIDSESLAAVGPWPWPRYHIARMTEIIASGHPAAIGFDMLFPEPDGIRPDIFAKFYPELSPAATAEVLKLPPMDRLFGQVIGQAPVVLGRAGIDKAGTGADQLIVDPVWQGKFPPGLPQWRGAIANIPDLEMAALGHGLLNGQPDDDAIVRSVPMAMGVGGRPMPGLALELARADLKLDRIDVRPGTVTIGAHPVPVDGQGRMRLHFGQFPYRYVIPAAEVLRKGFRADMFAGRIVLIGMAAEGTPDIVATPLNPEDYGTLVQAQATDAILSDGWLTRPAWAAAVEWGAGVGLVLLIVLLVPAQRRGRIVVPILFALALPIGAWLAFDLFSLILDPIRPLILGGGTAAGVIGAIAIEARRERERLRDTLVRERIDAAATEGELQAARTIQIEMLPSRESLKSLDRRVDVDAMLEPAKSVGGDFFDVVRLDDDRIAFVIADVTGKGVPAALFMALSKALTKSVMLRDTLDLGAAAALVNEEVSRDNPDTMGVTMLIGLLDLATGEIAMVSAGHEDPLHLRAGGDVALHKLEGGPPFCIMDYPYPVETLMLKPGEALVLTTDGVSEAQTPDGVLFGNDRLLAAIRGGARDSATAIVEGLRASVRVFEAGADASDDLTVMAVRYLGVASAATPHQDDGL